MFDINASYGCHVADSAYKEQLLIREFCRFIDLGYHPNDIQETVYRKLNIYPEELLEVSLEKVIKTVGRYYANTHRY